MSRFLFSALSTAATLACLTAGCAAQDTSDVGRGADELTSSASGLKEGSYNLETRYYRVAFDKPVIFNPPLEQDYIRISVTNVSSDGFRLEFKNSDGSRDVYPGVNCTLMDKTFACEDVQDPGQVIDGRNLPSDFDGRPIPPGSHFEATLSTRTRYVGVIVNDHEFISTETQQASCEGAPAECAGLWAVIAGNFGVDGIIGEKPQTTINRHVLIPAPAANQPKAAAQ